MSFPISFTSNTKLFLLQANDSYKSLFIQKVVARFQQIESIKFLTGDKEFSFYGSWFRFAWNGFNFLNGISKGRFTIAQTDRTINIRFTLYFTEYFIIALLFTIIPIITWISSIKMSILLFLVIWLFFYIGTSLISIVRFANFVRRIHNEVDKANNYSVDLNP